MEHVRLTATRRLCGDYGIVDAGQNFTTRNDIADELEAQGLAVRSRPEPVLIAPVILPAFLAKMLATPENKMLPVAENKAAEPQLKRRGRPPKR
jgi:hypothetical protein